MKKLIPLFVMLCVMLTACGFAGDAYRNYVTAILDATYHNDYEEYQELTGAATPDAESLYKLEVEALSQAIRDAYDIKSDKISEEIIDSYDQLAEAVLEKTKYTIRDVMHSENNYTVVLVLSPVGFWENSQDNIRKYYYSEFLHKYRAAPTEADADKLEEEYAFRVLEILQSDVDTMEYLEPVVYTCQIQNNTVSAQDWQKIDQLLLNLP